MDEQTNKLNIFMSKMEEQSILLEDTLEENKILKKSTSEFEKMNEILKDESRKYLEQMENKKHVLIMTERDNEELKDQINNKIIQNKSYEKDI